MVAFGRSGWASWCGRKLDVAKRTWVASLAGFGSVREEAADMARPFAGGIAQQWETVQRHCRSTRRVGDDDELYV